ncbi:MAG TPA: hypothetical protein VFJ16_31185 [Longimicrobium sp.]|nr:hypothetical protein [Longimicrobium sp.]
MGEEISAALTPDEWEDFRTGDPLAVKRGGMERGSYVLARRVSDAVGELFEISDGFDTIAVPQPAAHALAALALHGQPIGFTWADVDAVEEVTSVYASEYEGFGGEHQLTWERARSAVRRIAALLPPRDG